MWLYNSAMFSLISAVIKNRSLVWSLAKHDIKSRYLGSALGSIWIFVLPLINLAVMWFAFEKGLKVGKTNGVPFILFLVTGMFPWSFFSEAVSSASNAILEKSFLVKKVVFQVELLPVVKVVAAFILFLFLLSVMILTFLVYGYRPSMYWLQIPYYMICLLALVSAIAWVTSSVVVFYRDLGQVVAVALQIGFWATPIFWSPTLLPESLKFVTLLNPMAYIVGGFRDTFINQRWIWESPKEVLFFWGIVSLVTLWGLRLFSKLRPHFADVL